MRFAVITLLFFTSSTFISTVQARDKIGLVLSGGGAKGSAHIGVLKVLEQQNIPIDYVVGTSIGAYVGGMYALGYEVDDIEKIMLGLPWDNGFSDQIPRESLSYINKQHRDRYNLGIRLGYSDRKFKVPQGLLLGQSAYQVLQRSTDTIRAFDSFDDLAIPYRAVASDIATAQAVVLDSGSINTAMKASAAVPGILAGVEVDGKILVDGGITNNMPIDVVKKMGADIVIAVDIGSPLADQSKLTSSVSIIHQLSTILTNNTSLEQKSLLTEKDILLRPAIENLGTTDWSIMPEALVLGEKEANKNIPLLRKLSLDDAEYQLYKKAKKSKAKQWFDDLSNAIIEIKVINNSKVEKKTILQKLDVKIGKELTKEQLDAAIDRVYALDKFEQVTAEFNDTDEGRVLIVNTEAKSWGPNYLDFGFNLKTDFSHRTITNLNISYMMTDITANGGRWLNELEVGWETLIASEFYYIFSRDYDLFSRARISYEQDKWENTPNRGELTKKYYYGIATLGYDYSFKGMLELGFIAEKGSLDIKDPSIENINYDSYGSFITFGYDTLDSINFPTDGNKLLIKTSWLNDNYLVENSLGNLPELPQDEKDKAIVFSVDWRGAIDFRGHTFVGIASFVKVNNEADSSAHLTELGGFLNLSGYQQDALIGSDKLFGAVVYQYDLGQNSGLPIYLGASLEAGNVWQLNATPKYNDLITSGSAYIGTDTNFGPAVFGIGFASDGVYALFLSLGKNW